MLFHTFTLKFVYFSLKIIYFPNSAKKKHYFQKRKDKLLKEKFTPILGYYVDEKIKIDSQYGEL